MTDRDPTVRYGTEDTTAESFQALYAERDRLRAENAQLREERDDHESRADGWQSLGHDVADLLGVEWEHGLTTGQVYGAVRRRKKEFERMRAVVEAACDFVEDGMHTDEDCDGRKPLIAAVRAWRDEEAK